MIINVNTEEYEVSPEQERNILAFVRDRIEDEYAKLEPSYRLIIKPIAREILRRMEDKARDKFGRDEALRYRPAKYDDACLFLVDILLTLLSRSLRNVTVTLNGNQENKAVSYFNVSVTNTSESEAGRQVDTNGDKRMREDNGTTVP